MIFLPLHPTSSLSTPLSPSPPTSSLSTPLLLFTPYFLSLHPLLLTHMFLFSVGISFVMFLLFFVPLRHMAHQTELFWKLQTRRCTSEKHLKLIQRKVLYKHYIIKKCLLGTICILISTMLHQFAICTQVLIPILLVVNDSSFIYLLLMSYMFI